MMRGFGELYMGWTGVFMVLLCLDTNRFYEIENDLHGRRGLL